MALGGHRAPARLARRTLPVLATALVAAFALPAAAGAACDPTLPAEGVTTPASGCEVIAGFHVVSPTGTPVRLDPGGTLSVDGSDSTSTAGTVVQWAWDWGTGTFGADSGSPTATQTFARGNYDVRVRATDDAATPNVQASAPTHVFVAFPLTADFTATSTGQARTFNFNASASESGATSITYRWDFDGDGTYDTAADPSPSVQHTYPADGTYTAKLLVTDDLGQTVVPVHSVGAFNQAPVLSSASVSPNSTFVGTPVTLSANASDPDGSIVSYLWDLDGNGAADFSSAPGAGGASYVTSYPNPGTINVRIGAMDNSGGVTWATVPLTLGLPGGGNGTIDGGGALGSGNPGTATGPGAGTGGRGGVAFAARLGGTAFQKLQRLARGELLRQRVAVRQGRARAADQPQGQEADRGGRVPRGRRGRQERRVHAQDERQAQARPRARSQALADGQGRGHREGLHAPRESVSRVRPAALAPVTPEAGATSPKRGSSKR
jgi:hypothetical protein